MFEIRVFVEDSKLAKFLWGLDGMIVGPPQLTPVRNAEAKGGRVRSTQPVPGGTLAEQVAAKLTVWGNATITPTELRSILHSVGGKDGSYGGIIITLRNAGVISGKGGRGQPFNINLRGSNG